jgi:predicted neuraminidase
MLRPLVAFTIVLSLFAVRLGADEPVYRAELVFPLHAQHNHAPGIAECPNGDLLVSWYRGSGERKADDVAVYGARLKSGESQWSDAFLMVDTPGFPDGNTALWVDDRGRLWLFWPVVIANSWESCLTQHLVSDDYVGDGCPKWNWRGSIFLKPERFEERMQAGLKERAALGVVGDEEKKVADYLEEHLSDKLSARLGWQTRCKPTQLPSGRILLPLYTDLYSVSLMAISDDGGETWFASEPLAGFGNIQPAVLRRDDGTVVAYMRENGPLGKIRVAESNDEGMSWGPVGTIDLPNPGSGLDAVRLANGHWAMIYNDTTDGRHSLALSISEDEGRTWPHTRHLEKHKSGEYHYPAIIQSKDGLLHVVYSYFVEGGKSMKHAAVNEAWVVAGD